jgi:hypothetical protein
MCRSLLATNGLAGRAKAEAEGLLQEWRHLGGRPAVEEEATECGEQEWALLQRMEAFLAGSAGQAAGPALVHR